MSKPLLLLDVDGPLNPWACAGHKRPLGYETHRMRPTGWKDERRKPLRVWLNPTHGGYLKALAEMYELVWATTWEAEANEWIGPHLGLPVLEWIDWGMIREVRSDGVYFKTPKIVEYAAERPFVWVDDEISTTDREYVTKNHPGPHLLYQVNPRIGLLDGDFERLGEWAENV